MFPFSNAALIMAVKLWRWKMEMHFRHVFVMNRVLRLTWPERQFIDVVHSSVCPLGKKTINQIRRQNLVKAEVKRGNHCCFPCWLSKQLSKKMLFLQVWSENLFTLVVISRATVYLTHERGFITSLCFLFVRDLHKHTCVNIYKSVKVHTFPFRTHVSDNFHNVLYLKLFEVIITFISPQTSWSSNLPCVFI